MDADVTQVRWAACKRHKNKTMGTAAARSGWRHTVHRVRASQTSAA